MTDLENGAEKPKKERIKRSLKERLAKRDEVIASLEAKLAKARASREKITDGARKRAEEVLAEVSAATS